jgi:hypothetical protein
LPGQPLLDDLALPPALDPGGGDFIGLIITTPPEPRHRRVAASYQIDLISELWAAFIPSTCLGLPSPRELLVANAGAAV